MTCPFEVGDRVHELLYTPTNVDIRLTDEGRLTGTMDHIPTLDPFKPDATVTTLTARGFIYRYDQPIQFVRPDWGTTDGGEVFEEGFHMWRKVK